MNAVIPIPTPVMPKRTARIMPVPIPVSAVMVIKAMVKQHAMVSSF